MEEHAKVVHEDEAHKPELHGVDVREEDLEPQRGLHLATVVLHVAAAVILVLAWVQFGVWWLDRPPGNVGIGVLIGDTIRLIVFAGLIWAAGGLANLIVKTHYDVRAARILLARQTYMMKQMGIASGALPIIDGRTERRGLDPEDTVEPGSASS